MMRSRRILSDANESLRDVYVNARESQWQNLLDVKESISPHLKLLLLSG